MTGWWHRWSHEAAIDRYFAGRLHPRREAGMRARLERCATCRAHYERNLIVEAALPDGEARAAERLWRGIRTASRAERAIANPAPAGRAWWAAPRRLLLAGTAVAAGVILIVAAQRSREPVARGGGDALAGAPALHVFRSVSDHATEPLPAGASIHSRDGLLFAYSNPDPALTHLMVFAIDAAYGVHWYYPAYLRPGDNPESVPAVAGGVGVELGEEIRHALPPGPLSVHALFLREPHRVLEIEELVRAHVVEPRRRVDESARLPLPGSVQTSIMLEVTP